MTLNERMDDDLDAFFNVDEFAIQAIVGGTAVNGIFDRPHAETIEVSGYSPSLYFKTDDVSSVVEGTAVVAEGTSYTVVGIENGGVGITRLILQEAS